MYIIRKLGYKLGFNYKEIIVPEEIYHSVWVPTLKEFWGTPQRSILQC